LVAARRIRFAFNLHAASFMLRRSHHYTIQVLAAQFLLNSPAYMRFICFQRRLRFFRNPDASRARGSRAIRNGGQGRW
jgi:hypothetical protein